MTSTALNILRCQFVTSKDVHDESTVDSLLRMLLDVCGNVM